MSVADELTKMAQLRDQGVISEAEFQQVKQRLLARGDAPSGPAPVGRSPWERDGAYPDPLAPMPENYMVWAVLATIFCVWPIGLVAIVKASKVQRLWLSGEYGRAVDAGQSAKNWTIASAVVGVVLGIIVFAVAMSSHGRLFR